MRKTHKLEVDNELIAGYAALDKWKLLHIFQYNEFSSSGGILILCRNIPSVSIPRYIRHGRAWCDTYKADMIAVECGSNADDNADMLNLISSMASRKSKVYILYELQFVSVVTLAAVHSCLESRGIAPKLLGIGDVWVSKLIDGQALSSKVAPMYVVNRKPPSRRVKQFYTKYPDLQSILGPVSMRLLTLGKELYLDGVFQCPQLKSEFSSDTTRTQA